MNFEVLSPIGIKISSGVTHVHFLFAGPAGKIEAVLSVPESTNKFNAMSVICHPHPLHGGTLNNKVVYYMAKAINDLTVPTLRFNFRGVEQSEGKFSDAIGEREDLLAAIEKMQTLFPQLNLWLGGFSFGAYIALATALQCNAKKLITVAPAVHLYDFDQVTLPSCDWLLIQGDADEIVPWQEAITWAKKLNNPPTISILKDAGHFFHGRLNDLRETILSHLNPAN